MIETIPALDGLPGIRAAFLARVNGVDVDADRETVLARLAPVHEALRREAGFSDRPFITAEQVHGAKVVEVTGSESGPIPGADGLWTTRRGVCLGIYVADCAPVFLADRAGRAVGLVHSGKKGTEQNIVAEAIRQMSAAGPPTDLVAVIGPCIRPPHYEIDFAADIRRQLEAAGVGAIHDDRICTATNPARYYSYRLEKGRTGRMLALLALRD